MKPVHVAAFLIIAICLLASPRVLIPLTQQPVEDWRTDYLSAMGNDAPSPGILNFMEAWRRAEGMPESCFNPFATTQVNGPATIYNSHGVKCYETYEQGRQATIDTLVQSYPGYAEILSGLQTNNVDLAVAGLEASPWGTSVALVEQVYSEAPTVQQQGQAQSNWYSAQGCVKENFDVALEANQYRLQNFTIAPGETWSFNAAMGPAQYIAAVACGPLGGGWCNLAALYAQAARQLSVAPQFEDHGLGDLGGGPENSVAIWNVDGIAGSDGERQDLLLTNNNSRTVHLWIVIDGSNYQVQGETL